MANVTIKSLLIRKDLLRPETIDAIRNACALAALQKAVDLFGEKQALTIRDLNALDLQIDYNWFHETSNSTYRQWNAIAQGEVTVATSSVIGIYGVKLLCDLDGTIQELPISALRFDVGGARVAQWAIQCLDQKSNGAVEMPYQGLVGVTTSPIIVGEDITMTIYEYTRVASKAYDDIFLGVIVEKEGKTLKP